MSLQHATTEYGVAEISGWDARGEFFVEKAGLNPGESEVRTLRLRHQLRNGSVLFVRLLTWSGVASDVSIAHQVIGTGPLDGSESCAVKLRRFYPRYAQFDKPNDLLAHLIEHGKG
jgi:hypothetical protein